MNNSYDELIGAQAYQETMTVQMDPALLQDREAGAIYLAQLFGFSERDCRNLDALADDLSEVARETVLVFSRECLLVLCGAGADPAPGYGFRLLQVFADACDQNPCLHFRISGTERRKAVMGKRQVGASAKSEVNERGADTMEKNMVIRHASADDLSQMSRIEEISYPPLEGASMESLRERIHAFPECFWILEENGKIAAFINGMATDEKDLTDDMYDHAGKHKPDGAWQMIFSVVTDPEYRGKGYASMIMEKVLQDCRERGRAGVVLTCKQKLLSFYSKFGFVNEGVSQSTHGNVTWYQMRITFS